MLLNIEKLIYGGDGLARFPADAVTNKDRRGGKAVFVPFVLASEKIEASLTEEKPGFARARAATIIEPSPHRVAPPCPYFASCGGCHYQHAGYDHQLAIKKEILRENLRRIARLELSCDVQTHASPPWNYRNRSRLQLRTTPRFVLGYFKFGSHEVLPVEQCPISSPLINQAIAALWQAGRAGKAVEGVREIQFFASADDSQLQVELLCAPEARRAAVRAWAEELRAGMPKVIGVAAFREPQKGVQQPLVTVGASFLTYRTPNSSHRVSAGAFFQTNRFLTDELVNLVTSGRSGDVALDLYAGVGLFSTALSGNFRHTISVESSQTAANDLKYNLPANGKAIEATAEQYLGVARANRSPASEGKTRGRTEGFPGDARSDAERKQFANPDLVVVDPPRSGLGDLVAGAVAKLGAGRLTYVSCDPATLARDLIPLQASGYRVDQVHLIDLFPQTYHLESVLQLVR